MNQRIRDLDKQAKIWAMENTIFPISSHIPSGYITKFAELIVQECVEKCKTDWYGDSLDDICKQMKEHFGVEE